MTNEFNKLEDAIACAIKENLLFVWGWKSEAGDILYAANNSDHDATHRIYWDAATDLSDQFLTLAKAKQVAWTPAPVPEGKESAMRAFIGRTARCQVMVVQARIMQVSEDKAAQLTSVGHPVPAQVEYHAMLTTRDGKPLAFAKMPPVYADVLYRLAADACPPLEVKL